MFEDALQAVIESSPSSSVYIGCDSIRFKQNGAWFASYATVVIVHKDSCHGCKIFYNVEVQRDFGKTTEGLRNRLMNEVGYALAAADIVLPVLGDRKLEIHLDINNDPKHKSNEAMKEAIGWVRGLGLTPVIKPDGWAATHAADHAVRRKSFAR